MPSKFVCCKIFFYDGGIRFSLSFRWQLRILFSSYAVWMAAADSVFIFVWITASDSNCSLFCLDDSLIFGFRFIHDLDVKRFHIQIDLCADLVIRGGMDHPVDADSLGKNFVVDALK